MKFFQVMILCLISLCLIVQAVQGGNGRYKVYMNPQFRADQLLLDTRTGRTWQFTQESKEKYMFWHEIPRDELPLLDAQSEE